VSFVPNYSPTQKVPLLTSPYTSRPVGVGFSTVQDPESSPLTLANASIDFSNFLAAFTYRYPEYFHNGLYVAGESFGGRYVPRFVSDLAKKQLAGAPDALPILIKGIILVDALVDAAYPYLGLYELFCKDGPASQILRFNDSACSEMAAAMPEAERLQRICQSCDEPGACADAETFGNKHLYKFFQ
jgi:cathepsin A (carboxypeptidase C)